MDDVPQEKCTGQMIMAYLVVIGAFAALGVILYHPIPPENRDLVNIVIGMVIGTGFGSIISYYFGSSIGSRNKEKTIEQLNKAPPPDKQPAVVVNNAPVSPSGDGGISMPASAPQTVNVSMAPAASQTPAAAMSWNGQSVTKKDDGSYVAADGTLLKMDAQGNLVKADVV